MANEKEANLARLLPSIQNPIRSYPASDAHAESEGDNVDAMLECLRTSQTIRNGSSRIRVYQTTT